LTSRPWEYVLQPLIHIPVLCAYNLYTFTDQ
jgi:hypothetical protein